MQDSGPPLHCCTANTPADPNSVAQAPRSHLLLPLSRITLGMPNLPTRLLRSPNLSCPVSSGLQNHPDTPSCPLRAAQTKPLSSTFSPLPAWPSDSHPAHSILSKAGLVIPKENGLPFSNRLFPAKLPLASSRQHSLPGLSQPCQWHTGHLLHLKLFTFTEPCYSCSHP